MMEKMKTMLTLTMIPLMRRMKKVMKKMRSENGIPLRTAVHQEEERQFLVAESCLAKLLEKCGICGSPCMSSLNFTRGTMVGTRSQLTCGHVCELESQHCLNGMPWSNIFVAGVIVFSGSNTALFSTVPAPETAYDVHLNIK